MICSSCGTEFKEGIFCPECGTKVEIHTENANMNVVSSIEGEKQKAYDILNEYKEVEEEKHRIEELGWRNKEYPFNKIEDRIRVRMEIYQKAISFNVKTAPAKKLIEEMRNDLMEDYEEYKKEGGSVGKAMAQSIITIVICLFILSNFGTIGLIIWVLLIIGACMDISGKKKANKVLDEMEKLLKIK